MKALEEELQGKDKQIAALQEAISELEKTNRQLKDEQESLKTVNELRLDDINKLNTDLQKEVLYLTKPWIMLSAKLTFPVRALNLLLLGN